MAFSRYSLLSDINGNSLNFPNIKIQNRDTDKYIIYNPSMTRLDRISYDAYGIENFDWLIMLANPEYSVEFDIPSNTVIRVPFPLNDVLSEFQQDINGEKGKTI